MIKVGQGLNRWFPRKTVLPKGNYYTLTWGISYEFGGRTTAALERSSVLARQGNQRVTILTLAPEMKDRDRESELRADGRIDRRVSVRNLWKDLTSWSDRKLRRMAGTSDVSHAEPVESLPRTSDAWSEYRFGSNGEVLQTDRYADDGSLLLIDQRDAIKCGSKGGRLLTLLDSKGSIIKQWNGATELYSAWLDAVFAGRPSYVVNDSKLTGRIFRNYRRDNVVYAQMLHNHYLRDQTAGTGELSPQEFQYLSCLDRIDVAVTLTDHQRADMIAAGFSSKVLRTVPNSTADLHGDPNAHRNRCQGAMVGRLVKHKRVEDALAAVAQSLGRVPDLVLDVYGDGKARTTLEQTRQDLKIGSAVRFHGHTKRAKRHFLDASFSVLSSRSEGQGLVLLECMSAGCIPIAYDIEYGPRDIIANGVNGFLVSPGDTGALSEAIVQVTTMNESELAEMRAAALARAADFYEQRIAKRWGEVFAEQRFTPITRLPNLSAKLEYADVSDERIDLNVNVDGVDGIQPESVAVSWTTRQRCFFSKSPASLNGSGLSVSIPIDDFMNMPPDRIDFSVDIVGGRNLNRVRITSGDSKVRNAGTVIELYSTKNGNLSGMLPAGTAASRV